MGVCMGVFVTLGVCVCMCDCVVFDFSFLSVMLLRLHFVRNKLNTLNVIYHVIMFNVYVLLASYFWLPTLLCAIRKESHTIYETNPFLM